MRGKNWHEQGVTLESGDHQLTGVLAIPDTASDIGVVLLVGGPQYRVGSHRQFTLLCRDLAAAGIPSLRFDYAGMGDSDGEQHEFFAVQQDLQAAIDCMQSRCGVQRVVLWGLCDAASAAMMYAHDHTLVCGAVLLNPWVHGDDYSARVKLSHYYRPLLKGRQNWRRLLSGEIDLVPAAREFASSSARAVAGLAGMSGGSLSRHSFVQQMLAGFQQLEADCLVILSEDDLTAKEFSSLVDNDKAWSKAMARPSVTIYGVSGADHTFSTGAWMDEVASTTIDWVKAR